MLFADEERGRVRVAPTYGCAAAAHLLPERVRLHQSPLGGSATKPSLQRCADVRLGCVLLAIFAALYWCHDDGHTHHDLEPRGHIHSACRATTFRRAQRRTRDESQEPHPDQRSGALARWCARRIPRSSADRPDDPRPAGAQSSNGTPLSRAACPALLTASARPKYKRTIRLVASHRDTAAAVEY